MGRILWIGSRLDGCRLTATWPLMAEAESVGPAQAIPLGWPSCLLDSISPDQAKTRSL